MSAAAHALLRRVRLLQTFEWTRGRLVGRMVGDGGLLRAAALAFFPRTRRFARLRLGRLLCAAKWLLCNPRHGAVRLIAHTPAAGHATLHYRL